MKRVTVFFVPLICLLVLLNGPWSDNAQSFSRGANELIPHPRQVAMDKGRLWSDRCVVFDGDSKLKTCSYGDPVSETTIVAFGDSHTLQWSPTLIQLAEQNDWHLISMVKASCVIALVRYKADCNQWRQQALNRIATLNPDFVISSTSTANRYRVLAGQRRLNRKQSQPYLIRGFKQTMNKITDYDTKTIVIRDQTIAPFPNPPKCILNNLNQLQRCSFPVRYKPQHAFDVIGSRRAQGVVVINPNFAICPRGRCSAVRGNIIVYRDNYHISATFARTLVPWLDRQLLFIPTLRIK